jgi:hypothetical protein
MENMKRLTKITIAHKSDDPEKEIELMDRLDAVFGEDPEYLGPIQIGRHGRDYREIIYHVSPIHNQEQVISIALRIYGLDLYEVKCEDHNEN